MDKSTREILGPFVNAFRKPRKPYSAKVRRIDGSIVHLDNGLKISMPKDGRKLGVGELVVVIDGRAGIW